MKEFFNKNQHIIGVILVVLIMGTARHFDTARNNAKAMARAEDHIKTVTLVDRNCNDCHLGPSFINLFTHPAVKGNDNVAMSMLDKAHIKRW